MSKKQYIYEEVRDFIKKRIDSGAYEVGSKIPSENEFAKVFGVHRKTIRTSIAMLVEEGLLKTIPGKGTYVVGLEEEIHLFERYRTDNAIHENGTVEVINAVIRKVGNLYCHIFNCSSEELMYSINLLRNVDSKPLIFEQIFIPVRFISDLERYDLKAFNIADILNFEGINLKRIQQKLDIVNISTRNGKYLNLEKYDQVLLLEKLSYDENDLCVEYKKQYIRGDLVKISNVFGDRKEV